MAIGLGRKLGHLRALRRVGVLLVLAAIATTAASALDPTRSIDQFRHTSWDIKFGIPANIRAIAQTRDGYLWLGSVNGLYRFDGLRVERIAAGRLASPSVDALAVTRSGGIWVGYERPVGVISLLDRGKITNYKINVPSSSAVHGLVIGPDQTVWASTPDVILRFDGSRWEMMQSDWGSSFGEAPGGVWAFDVDRRGVVWSKNLRGVFYLLPGTKRFVRAAGYPGSAGGFARDARGQLLSADPRTRLLFELPTLDRLANGAPPLGTLRTFPIRGHDSGAGAPDSLRGPMLLDRDGTLWFASSNNGGLFRTVIEASTARRPTTPGGADRFTATDGLSSDLVHTLFEDREGNVWIGTGLGLDRFGNANVVTEKAVPVGFRARFVEASKDALIVYTGWSATSTRDTDGTQSLYRIFPGRPPELFVRNVGRLRGIDISPKDGSIWLTTQKGMQPLAGQALGSPIGLPGGVRGDQIFSGVRDTGGHFWISAYGAGVFRRLDDGRWEKVDVHSRVRSTGVLIPDPDGSMWVRFSGGSLFNVTGASVRDYSDNGLDIGDVTFVKPRARGLIIGGESGLGRILDGRFHALRTADVAALSGITGIAESSDGRTWIFTQDGILRIATVSLEQAFLSGDVRGLHFDRFDSLDGLPGTPHGGAYGSTAATGPGGRIWFTTGNGLVWIDPRNLDNNRLAPTVEVRAVSADGKRYDFPRDLRLPAGTKNLQIDYVGLSLSLPERNRYLYRLDGIDSDWVNPGSRREAFYTNLGPGTYAFHVLASNDAGVWNREGATIKITIPPTFFQSTLFILLVAVALGFLLWAAYAWRMRRLAVEIRNRVETRLAERERIARELHDTLLQGFQGLLLRFQTVANLIPDGQPARSMIDRVLDRAELVLVEGRNRVQELRTPDADLPRHVTKIGEELASGDVDFALKVEGMQRTLDPLVLDETSRIASEAIRNALRHAEASRIDATIAYRRNDLELCIADDGQGLDEEVARRGQREGHYGLVGMRERAERIGGTLTITNLPDGGCQVRLVVPARLAYAGRPARRRAPGTAGGR